MIEKDYTLKITTAEAEANLKQLNSTLDEQREILIMLEKDLLKVQQTQRKTSKTNLEAQRRLTKQADHLKDAIKDQRLGLRTLNTERRAASSAITELNKGSKEHTNIVRGIDKLTGGYATKVIKLKKGLFSSIKVIKGFIGGLSGIKKALIATGIGAFAVGLGLVVAYWEDLVALFDDGSKALQNQAKEINENIELNNLQLTSLQNQEKILELQGKSTKKIKEEKKKILIIQQEQNRLLLENLKTQLLREKEQQKELTFFEKAKIAVAGVLGGVGGTAYATAKAYQQTTEEAEKLKEINDLITEAKTNDEKITIKLLEIEKKAADEKKKSADEIAKATEKAEKEKADAIERIRQGLIDTEAERRAEELRLIQEDYDQQIELAAKFYGANSIKILELREAQRLALKAQQDAFDLEDKERQDKIDAEAEKKRLKGIADAKKVAEELAALEEKKRQDRLDTFDNLVAIGGAETIFGQAMLIAKQLLLAKELIMDVKSTLFAAKTSVTKTVIKSTEAGVDVASGAAKAAAAAPFPGNIPLIVGYAAQAVGIVSAIKSAVKASKQATKGIGGGGGGDISAPSIDGGSVPPAFNIVGASGESQLADAIGGQSQRPSRSYVVASDVSTAQELDRNIIEGASIG